MTFPSDRNSAGLLAHARLSRRAVIAGAGAALVLPAALGPANFARAQILGTGGATAYRRMIGEIEVTAILDGFIEIGREALVGIDDAELAEALVTANRDPEQAVPTGITAHLLRTPDRVILVDAGASNGFGPTAGRLMAGLTAAGITPDDVDLILVTHMHGDHIGGLLADGAPAFPNAEVRIAAADLDFWTDEAIAAQAPADFQSFFALPRAVATAYGERITPFADADEVATGITAVALPGHTPGHSGFHVESAGQRLLLWADVVHLASVQFARPEAGIVFDTDVAEAATTRARVLDMVASEGLLFAGAHLPFPAFGYAEAAGDGAYIWRPEEWAYQ